MNFSGRPLGRVLALVAVAGTVLTVSCSGDDPVIPATPGEVVVVLRGALAGDRAILLDIGQGAITVTPGSGELQMHARADGGRFIVAVFGQDDGGDGLQPGEGPTVVGVEVFSIVGHEDTQVAS